MKLLIPCGECLGEGKISTGSIRIEEIRDDGIYEVICSEGHTSKTVLREQKFQILFEIGAHAIIDGYYREAISSFTSSLERFHEFCIKFFCQKNGIEGEAYQKIWKNVSKQSERQLGAFIFLWTTEFKISPDILHQDNVSFRNRVIHNGYIPNKEEAIKYGTSILKLIQTKIYQLKREYPEELEAAILQNPQETQPNLITTICNQPLINLADQEKPILSLEELLLTVSEWRKIVSKVENSISKSS